MHERGEREMRTWDIRISRFIPIISLFGLIYSISCLGGIVSERFGSSNPIYTYLQFAGFALMSLYCERKGYIREVMT